MTTNEPQTALQSRKPRSYHVTADCVIVGLLPFEGFLVLSEWFGWFPFNGQSWTVLIAFAGMTLAVFLLLLWFTVALLFRRRFQYHIRSLMLLAVGIAVPCSWLAVEKKHERRQGEKAQAIGRLGGRVGSELTWLGRVLQDDSLVTVTQVSLAGMVTTDTGLLDLQELRQLRILMLNGSDIADDGLMRLQVANRLWWLVLDSTGVTDAGLGRLQRFKHLRWLYLNCTAITDAGLVRLQGLSQLQTLLLNGTKITDAGLVHLQGLTCLEVLGLEGTQVTDAGVKRLQHALPSCKIIWCRAPVGLYNRKGGQKNAAVDQRKPTTDIVDKTTPQNKPNPSVSPPSPASPSK